MFMMFMLTKNKIQKELRCSICEEEKKDRYCKACGRNTGSQFSVIVTDTVGAEESLSIKQKTKKFKKFAVKIFQGFKSSVDKNKYPKGVEIDRRIDKINNWYNEVVRCKKTNEIVNECHEPLSLHIKHGSAKKR